MKILIIGSGGREHAIAWRLTQDATPTQLFCAPGNAGTAALGTNVALAADDLEGLLHWAQKHRPDLTVVGPEVPLCLGLVDQFTAAGLRVFGPVAAAARLEGSKLFAKEIMAAAGVRTAQAQDFDDAATAIAALDTFNMPVVLKADGLAAGKGVVIAQNRAEAVDAINAMLVEGVFGASGQRILIETFLTGAEASVLALVDGEEVVLLPPAQDYKRIYDGDEGPNTGGMGAYTPVALVPDALLPTIKETIILPVVRELRRRGITYRGVLYAGLMVGADGIHVLEFNVRFGDPETQAVLLRLGGNFGEILKACADGTLNQEQVQVRDAAAVTVVVAAAGYPAAFRKGLVIEGLAEAAAQPHCTVFHAGTTLMDDRVLSAGGRVLAVSALGQDLKVAREHAYQAVAKIKFDDMYYRKDIALKTGEED